MSITAVFVLAMLGLSAVVAFALHLAWRAGEAFAAYIDRCSEARHGNSR